jgi:hypothetical protein
MYDIHIFVGITQEEIDEKRLIPERRMLNDVSRLARSDGPLDERGSDGATLVSKFDEKKEKGGRAYGGNKNVNDNLKMVLSDPSKSIIYYLNKTM